MDDQYGLSDLRQYIDGRSFFPAISQPPDLLSCHRGLSSPNPYDMLMIRSDSAAAAAVSFGAEPALGGDGGSGRWPRQETLTLLEIRSRLDPRFKEANQKGPLWDEVARIMSEENGYQRSGKKCREKFENLYKYYKKTKEGKSGRQDGKHYRFFRQLEALYGETSNSASATHFNSLLSDQEGAPASCDYDTTSSYCSDSNVRVMDSGNGDSREKKRRDRRRLKANIEESIDAQMKNMMEKQEEWMEKMTRVIESKERERLMREEQWRKQDAVRIEREREIWAGKRAWVEARDAALAEAINQLAGKELQPPAAEEDEIARLIQLRSGMESKFQENGISEEAMARMGCSGLMCREKWDQTINDYLIKCSKKRRENSNHDDDEGVAGVERLDGHGNSPMNDGFFRYFIGESYQRL